MKKYVLKRLLIAVVTLFLITLILFVMEKAMPGSPFNDEKMSHAQVAALYRKYGLDGPIWLQFFNYLKNMITGDFGVSYTVQVNTPVTTMIFQHFKISLQIGLQATILGSIIGFFMGVLAAVKKGTIWDNLMTGISVLGISLPNFVVALIISLIFSYKLMVLPGTYQQTQPFVSSILPTIALSTFTMASIERYVRNDMITILDSDYYRLADSKGIKKYQLIMHHVIRNTLISVITVLAPLMIDLIAGSMVIEKAFAIPGLGTLYISAIQANDYNVVLGITFFYAVLFIGIMLVVDILYGLIDPRIRLDEGE